MTGEIELVTDLDCGHRNITNIGGFDPIPDTLVSDGDPRLSDQRHVPNGSITNDSVSEMAGIVQSKLNLGGNIPNAWTGTHANQAAQGNLAEYTSRKGVANGYAGLDSNGLLDLSVLPFTGPQTGTVIIINLDFPDSFSLHSTFTGVTLDWISIPNNSWLGVNGPSPGFTSQYEPSFITNQIPDDLIPDLDANQFTTGTFALARLPVVKGLGVGHAKGIAPDPGDSRGTQSDKTDYLARDGSWKSIYADKDYQPIAPHVQITFLSFYRDQTYIQIHHRLKKGRLFYRVGPSVSNEYQESTHNPLVLLLDPDRIVNAYVAKAGYNNSRISQFVVPTNPTP